MHTRALILLLKVILTDNEELSHGARRCTSLYCPWFLCSQESLNPIVAVAACLLLIPAVPTCRYAYPVTYESHSMAADGSVAEVRVTYDPDYKSKGKPPKGVVNWLAQPQFGKNPAVAEARLYTEGVCHVHCCDLQRYALQAVMAVCCAF